MLYIGFSLSSHKIISNIFCKTYKHCAPIEILNDNVVIHQFEHVNKIVDIHIQQKHLSILEKHGWIFIRYDQKKHIPQKNLCLTCVQFTKQFCGIKNKKIQTPDKLLKYIK